ncbi:MAG: antibiotic biosynthesis monooxygenase [Henriciella sp.]|nr:antibiotic biosynthesis monooxygenase [Henriciella sp.]
MIVVEGYVRMQHAGDFERVRGAATAQIEASRAEGGCIDYTYAIDVLDPHIMRVLERWDSWETLEAHFKMSHMEPWRAALKDVKFLERSLRAHEVRETRDV